jgi:hypothetical protein
MASFSFCIHHALINRLKELISIMLAIFAIASSKIIFSQLLIFDEMTHVTHNTKIINS